MTTYEITYTKTGKINKTDKVWINTGDEMKSGKKIDSIIDAIEYFEELAESWGTYETKHAITEIREVGER